MNPLTLEWVTKAEGDFVTAGREIRARNFPNYDSSCFHSQQTVEKYLKALLQEWGQPVPRVHGLIDLLSLCISVDNEIAQIRPDLQKLEGYSVRFRYPGYSATKKQAKEAYLSALIVRNFIRSHLGL